MVEAHILPIRADCYGELLHSVSSLKKKGQKDVNVVESMMFHRSAKNAAVFIKKRLPCAERHVLPSFIKTLPNILLERKR